LLYILRGEDDYSRRQALNEILKSASDSLSAGSNVTYIDGASVTTNELMMACQTVPFLSDKRVVVVSHLLDRFEPKEKAAGSKKSAKSDEGTKEWQQFAEIGKSLPDTTILVFIDDAISNKNLLFPVISENAKVMAFPPISNREIPQWIRRKVEHSGGKISVQASEYMAKMVGNELWTLSNELDKLLAYTGGRPIEEQDIKTLVTHAQETSIFALLDAIMDGRTNAAQELLAQAMTNGMSPSYILTMLARQIRLAILMKELTAQNKARSEIQSKLALADFPFQKTEEQAAKYSLEQLKEFYSRLLETDIAIKTGKYDEELALTILVAEMSRF
jgi:DNA polymerase-3 subunit delta